MSDEQTIYIALQDFSYLGRRYRSGDTVDTARMRSDVIDGLVKNGRVAPTIVTPVPTEPATTPDAPEPTEPTPDAKPTRKNGPKGTPDAG